MNKIVNSTILAVVATVLATVWMFMPASQLRASSQSTFDAKCAMCHGKDGDGKGDLAAIMHINPSNLTNPQTLANRTDGELFTIIDKGSASMPAQGSRLKKDQTWDLVNFLRSLEGKTPAKSAKTQASKVRR